MGRRSILDALFNHTPIPYVSARNLTFPHTAPTGAEAQMRAMGAVGTLFAIVNRTSNATAAVDWKLWRTAASGRPEDRTEVTRHAALDLWNKPNPFMTRQEFVESFQQHLDLTGEAWWVIARNNSAPLPLELWPVRPDRMDVVPHPTDFITRYTYRGPGGETIPLERDQVIFLRTPNPLDPYRGMGPVQSILIDLEATRFAAEWNRNFFLNSAEPGGIIEVDKRLGDDEFEELRTRWNEQHKGIANSHRVALLEQGKWVDRKYTQRDMQFTELRSASRETIREAFGIPKFAVGDVEDVNRATAEASKAWFAEQLTVPRLERVKQALNNDLLPLYGPTGAGLEFDYCSPVPVDTVSEAAQLTARAGAAKALRDAGWDPDDVLSAVGLPAMRYPTPAPQLPSAPGPNPPPGPTAARLDIHHHTPPATASAPTSAARARTLRPPLAAAGPDLEPVRVAFTEALTALLDDWEGVSDAQLAQLHDQITAAVDAGDTAALATLTVDAGGATALLRGALADLATVAAARMAAEAADQGVTVRPPKVDSGLRNAFGSELIEIATATVTLIGSDLAASAGREALRLFTPGTDGEGVATRVVDFLRGLKNWLRRDQLAGALHRAQNLGRLATLQAAPKAVYTASERLDDPNTCPACLAIDGTVFTDLAAARAAYGAGGYTLCAGGVRCRGTIIATWDTTGGEN